MGYIDKLRDSEYVKDLFERASKTFLQFYLGYWLFLNPETTSAVSPDAFDTLFTTDNLKAGAVGVALSAATSIGSRYVGSHETASLVK
jgi:hypothetical protein